MESLVEQPMVMSYHDFTPSSATPLGIPDNMIRISCGIENGEDLIADLEQALKACSVQMCNSPTTCVPFFAVRQVEARKYIWIFVRYDNR